MNNKVSWKIWAPIIILEIVAFAMVGLYQPETETIQTSVIVKEKAVKAMPATGSIDDAVKAILVGVSDDQAFFSDVEKDINLITADNQEINDFGQSYDENEF